MYPVGQVQDSIDRATPMLTSDPSSTAVSIVMSEILKEETGNEVLSFMLHLWYGPRIEVEDQ